MTITAVTIVVITITLNTITMINHLLPFSFIIWHIYFIYLIMENNNNNNNNTITNALSRDKLSYERTDRWMDGRTDGRLGR